MPAACGRLRPTASCGPTPTAGTTSRRRWRWRRSSPMPAWPCSKRRFVRTASRGIRRSRRQRALPILMDEGIVSPDELVEFIRLGMLDGVAMKPARCGGLLPARRQIEMLLDAGLMWLGSGLTDPDVSLAATLALFYRVRAGAPLRAERSAVPRALGHRPAFRPEGRHAGAAAGGRIGRDGQHPEDSGDIGQAVGRGLRPRGSPRSGSARDALATLARGARPSAAGAPRCTLGDRRARYTRARRRGLRPRRHG